MTDSVKNTDYKVSFTFKKEERLCSKKITDKLFSEGKSFLSFPLKVVCLETALPTKYSVQAGFTVGKKNFKRAVKRNLIRRKIREAYRLNKHLLINELNDKQIAVFFIYIDKEIPDYKLVESAVKKAIKRIPKELNKLTANNE